MIEINSPKIDKNLLEEEIEHIIDRYKKNPQKIKNITIKKVKFSGKKIYTIEDFTKYHDREFIENLYRKVLLREVENKALNHRLELLRSGKRSKSEILSMVRFSKEGRRVGINILGIKKRYIMTILYRIPILSSFTKVLTLPRLIERLNRFESHYFIAQEEQNIKIDTKLNIDTFQKDKFNIENSTSKKFKDLENSASKKFKDLENSTSKKFKENKFYIEELELRIKEIQRAKESLKEMEKSLKSILLNIKNNTKDSCQPIFNKIENEQIHFLDSLYISFEDKFRGSREDIKKRQSYYLPIVKDILHNTDGTILDIGCGRGEWLELLKENSIEGKGIDLNRLMVSESKKYGLDVVNQDATKYIKSQKDNSIAIITGFHIVEHLPFEVLILLFDEAFRVLKKGGVVIFETPNPENLMVGACNFYTDPTHLNPIPPVTLEFLIKNRGFEDVAIHRLHPVKEASFVDIANSQDINDLIYASTKAQDYSIIGYKK